jgi:hypothetical protein
LLAVAYGREQRGGAEDSLSLKDRGLALAEGLAGLKHVAFVGKKKVAVAWRARLRWCDRLAGPPQWDWYHPLRLYRHLAHWDPRRRAQQQ